MPPVGIRTGVGVHRAERALPAVRSVQPPVGAAPITT